MFQYYPGDIRSTKPKGLITLDQMLQAIHYPKNNVKQICEEIKKAGESNDKAEKDRLKRQLYFFTPCALFDNKRSYANIVNFTGLLLLDFDKLERDYAIEFKHALFDEYKFIIASWLSVSGHGVRAIVRIPQAKTTDEFKQYFEALKQEVGGYRGFDSAPKNPALPLFISHDPVLRRRNDAELWTKKYIPPQPVLTKVFYKHENYSDKIEEITRKAIAKIYDNGHPQLRAMAFALGGYIQNGHISQQDAIELINSCIDQNFYLSRKTKNSSFSMADTYKKTALTMIIKGQEKGLSPQ